MTTYKRNLTQTFSRGYSCSIEHTAVQGEGVVETATNGMRVFNKRTTQQVQMVHLQSKSVQTPLRHHPSNARHHLGLDHIPVIKIKFPVTVRNRTLCPPAPTDRPTHPSLAFLTSSLITAVPQAGQLVGNTKDPAPSLAVAEEWRGPGARPNTCGITSPARLEEGGGGTLCIITASDCANSHQ